MRSVGGGSRTSSTATPPASERRTRQEPWRFFGRLGVACGKWARHRLVSNADLDAKDRRVLKSILKGETVRAGASLQGISKSAVSNHRRRVKDKLRLVAEEGPLSRQPRSKRKPHRERRPELEAAFEFSGYRCPSRFVRGDRCGLPPTPCAFEFAAKGWCEDTDSHPRRDRQRWPPRPH